MSNECQTKEIQSAPQIKARHALQENVEEELYGKSLSTTYVQSLQGYGWGWTYW